MKKTPLFGLGFLCNNLKHPAYILFLIFLLSLASGSRLAAQGILNTDVTIRFEKTPVKTALRLLEKQTKCSFVYSDHDLRTLKPISGNYESEPLINVLKKIFGAYLSNWQVKNNRQIVLQFGIGQGGLAGRVVDPSGKPVGFLTVIVAGRQSVITKEDGTFSVNGLPVGELEVTMRFVGQKDQSQLVKIEANKRLKRDLTFIFSDQQIEAVRVVGRSALQDVQEQAYNVEVLNAKELHNTSLDVAQALDRAGGVRVRTSGGVGSRADIAINGFSGNHVKVFVDGVPIESFGTTFQLSNIPVALANRVEIYKGVSPVSLAADALGGVINVVTDESKKSFVNASYSYGSFNTRKTFASAGYKTDKNWVFKANLIHNYSDNDYKVDATILDMATGQYLPETKRVRRFHDAFRNTIIIAQVGVINKSYADRFFLGFNTGFENKEEQTGSQMKFVFGQVRRRSHSVSPFLNYEKKKLFNSPLDLRATINYDWGTFRNIDTATVYYNWLGEAKKKLSPGEFNYSMAVFNYRDGGTTLNLQYNKWEKHRFAMTNIVTFYARSGRDSLNYDDGADMIEAEKKSVKNVTGLSYQFIPNEHWNSSLFFKSFLQRNEGPQSSGGGRGYTLASQNYKDFGYGFATTYFFTRLQTKFSFENTLRLPTTEELFGNETYNAGNISLQPERSNNFNLNLIYDMTLQNVHQLEFALGLTYRNTKDFIIRSVGGSASAPSTLSNHGLVDNKGISGEVKYYYGKYLSLGANLTYQDLRFKNKYDPGDSGEKISLSYNTRVPNTPYLFSNAFVDYSVFNVLRPGNTFRLGYNMLYVYEFPLHTADYGGNDIAMIPTQFTHSVFGTYSMDGSKWTITGEVWNITDENVYDNWSFQKPGRSFSLKLAYSISRNQ
ncbi:TonB-dependent receptor [Sphingobacterium sp. LRF_L2]|uniref:TonB-dependent receptor n=1 Tax=Sphingobacterium sp. LRF_L2 TaxID=3369421 RepID=UPI003F6026B7